MAKHHKITGVATITGVADGMGQSPLAPLPATVTMDPAGIDLFHALLQIVFAHKYSPYRITAESNEHAVIENRKAAVAFLAENSVHHKRGCKLRIDATYPDAFLAQYALTHQNRPTPLVVRIDPRLGLNECLSVLQPVGVYVRVDLNAIRLSAAPTG